MTDILTVTTPDLTVRGQLELLSFIDPGCASLKTGTTELGEEICLDCGTPVELHR